MPIIKIATALFVSLLPLNFLRVSFYRLLFRYRISNSRIGFGTVIAVDDVTIQSAKIGMFNLLMGPFRVKIGKGVSIGNRNTFACGYWVLQDRLKEANYTRTFEAAENAVIVSSHYFDLAGTFRLGKRSWIAGIGSQFWTHGAGEAERDIKIGDGCYVGSAVRFAPGSSIGDNVLVAMGSVVSGVLDANHVLVGGVPAKVLRENYDWKSLHD